jgi:hypothetical protein
MGPCLSPELCTNVFKVVQAAAKPTPPGGGSSSNSSSLGPSGLAAIQVVTSILDKKLVPKQLEVRGCVCGAGLGGGAIFNHPHRHPPAPTCTPAHSSDHSSIKTKHIYTPTTRPSS